MDIGDLIRCTREAFDPLNPPATESDIGDLQSAVGPIPQDLLLVYGDHDGSDRLPKANESYLPARLMPIHEVLETRIAASSFLDALPKAGAIALFWTDDNSNYCGIYTDGPLSGWVFVLDHEEPILTPAFRSTNSFLLTLLSEAVKSKGQRALDIRSIRRETPEVVPDPIHLEQDRQLASGFRQLYNNETDEDLRRLFALCSICLTPFEDTGDVLEFLDDTDMWTPESAIRLLEVRRSSDGVDRLEKLSREGRPNGDSAAMRQLALMNTEESRESIARLKQTLEGRKLRLLEMWLRGPLQPLRWP